MTKNFEEFFCAPFWRFCTYGALRDLRKLRTPDSSCLISYPPSLMSPASLSKSEGQRDIRDGPLSRAAEPRGGVIGAPHCESRRGDCKCADCWCSLRHRSEAARPPRARPGHEVANRRILAAPS